MPKYYQAIPGWFDFESIYDEMVDRFGCSIFIEVGSFQGKSACYLAEKIKESGKEISLVCVDLFPTNHELDLYAKEGSGQGEEAGLIRALPDSLINVFIQNMHNAGVSDIVIPIKGDSVKVAGLFSQFVDGKSPVQFIFLDNGHGYDNVFKELGEWMQVLGADGVIAGHDWTSDSVNCAVKDFFIPKGMNIQVRGNSWLVQT